MNLYEQLLQNKYTTTIVVSIASIDGKYYMFPCSRGADWFGIASLDYIEFGDSSEFYDVSFVSKIKKMFNIALKYKEMNIGEMSEKNKKIINKEFNKSKKVDFENYKSIEIYITTLSGPCYDIYIENRMTKTEWRCHEDFLEKVDINASDEELHKVFLRQYEKADGKIHVKKNRR